MYIHYGSDYFIKDKFKHIKNRSFPWVKPEPFSGLWASPVKSNNGWKTWCEDNDFTNECNLEKSFIFSLKDSSKILYIRNDFELYSLKYTDYLDIRSSVYFLNDDLYCLDFEKLQAIGYDAVEVHVNTNDIYLGFYGWDCDSILVLNPDCIVEFDKERITND